MSFQRKRTCCIHLWNLSTLQGIGYIYWLGGGSSTNFTWNEGSWRPAYFCVPSNQVGPPHPWARPIKTCLSWSFGNRRRMKTNCFRINQAKRKKRSRQNRTKANLLFKTSSQIPMDEVITSVRGTLLPGSQALAVPRPLICKSLWGRGEGKRLRKEPKGLGSGAIALSVTTKGIWQNCCIYADASGQVGPCMRRSWCWPPSHWWLSCSDC